MKHWQIGFSRWKAAKKSWRRVEKGSNVSQTAKSVPCRKTGALFAADYLLIRRILPRFFFIRQRAPSSLLLAFSNLPIGSWVASQVLTESVFFNSRFWRSCLPSQVSNFENGDESCLLLSKIQIQSTNACLKARKAGQAGIIMGASDGLLQYKYP